jgi:flagellin-specific chaperone FliS
MDIRRITTIRNMVNELRASWVEIIAKNAAETMDRPQGVNIAG